MDKALLPTVSILIPARNEEKFIAKTLESVFAQVYPASQIEIFVMDGESTDRTPEIVSERSALHPNLHLLKNPQRLQSVGLNIGIEAATGEYIVRMDAHAIYAPDYLAQCVEALERTGAGEVGGVQRATGTTYFTQAVAMAMGHPFGVGNARFRYTDREIWAETVYLGAWKSAVLRAMGGFAEGLNEEGELNFRLRQAGYRILVSPAIRVQYLVRHSLPALIRQYAWYGRSRVQTLVRHPESVLYRQLAAPSLVMALILSAVAFPISHAVGLAIPVAYLVADFGASIWLAWRSRLRYFPALMVIFPAMHISWGVGFFAGIVQFGLPRLTFRSIWRSLIESPSDVPPPAKRAAPYTERS